MEQENKIEFYSMIQLSRALNKEKQPTLSITPTPYMGYKFLDNDLKLCKAAGAAIVATIPMHGDCILFVKETRKNTGINAVYNLPGGKVDFHERGNPIISCVREVWEETCCTIDLATKDPLCNTISDYAFKPLEGERSICVEEKLHHVFWHPAGKYCLFFFRFDSKTDPSTICDLFQTSKDTIPFKVKKHYSMDCTESIHWIPMSNLRTCMQSPNEMKHLIPVSDINGFTLPIFKYTLGILKNDAVIDYMGQRYTG